METLKKMILLSSIFLFLGCKVKRIQREETKIKEKMEVEFKHKIDSIVKSKESKEDITTVKENDSKKEDYSNVEIKGKVDKDNPLHYYTIKNGDTISSISIVGNADFIYNDRSSFTDYIRSNDSISVKNTQKESSVQSNSVVDKVVNTATEVQEKTVQVVKKGFSVGTYIVFFLLGLVVIVGLILLRWFKKPEIFNKIFRKDEND